MEDMLISVITPCFNSVNTIERTLECIENQTYKNIEYIIVDGGSTDGTMDIINKHRNRLPAKLIVISEPDKGIYDAMNKGIDKASGKLVGIVNSDDWYENDTVEKIVANYKGNPYEIVYGMQRVIQNEKIKEVVFYHHDFQHEKNINHPTCFITKQLYSDFGAYDLQYKSAADFDFLLRMTQNKQVVFNPVMEILSNFRTGGMSGSQVGVRENMYIRYKNGYVSKKKYYFSILKSRLYQILHG